MKKYAVIVAGGSGSRMGTATPKQFLKLQGISLLQHSVMAFQKAFADVTIIIVVPVAHLDNPVIQSLQSDNITVTAGGETRFHSVQKGLQLVPEGVVVFVHDAVRCLVSPLLIQRCYHSAAEKGSAIPVVAATDSLRIDNGTTNCVADRRNIKIVQTPQTFRSEDLKAAFTLPYNEQFTDEATVLEAWGKPVYLVEGEYENFKVTRPLDLLIAENILQARRTENAQSE